MINRKQTPKKENNTPILPPNLQSLKNEKNIVKWFYSKEMMLEYFQLKENKIIDNSIIKRDL